MDNQNTTMQTPAPMPATASGAGRKKIYLAVGLIAVAVLAAAWFLTRGNLPGSSVITGGPADKLWSVLPADFLSAVPAVISSQEKMPDGTLVVRLSSKTITPNTAVSKYTALLKNSGWRVSNKFENPNQIITATNPAGDVLTLTIDLRITGIAGSAEGLNTAITVSLSPKK